MVQRVSIMNNDHTDPDSYGTPTGEWFDSETAEAVGTMGDETLLWTKQEHFILRQGDVHFELEPSAAARWCIKTKCPLLRVWKLK